MFAGADVGIDEGVDVGEAVSETHDQVRVEGDVIVNVTTDEPPEPGTLPVPTQPEQVYPESGDETYAVMFVLLLNQPLVGEGESYFELTIK